jgi:hypothetical protein
VTAKAVGLGGSVCNKRKHHLEVSMNSRLFLVEANKILPFDSLWATGDINHSTAAPWA